MAKADPCLVPIANLRRLSADLAERYATRTLKTLSRDVNELERMRLIVREGQSIRANSELLTQFLPRRRGREETEEGK